MAFSDYEFLQVRPKTKEAVAYHNDDSRPGKPLRIVVPGALLALASLGGIIYVVYQTWFESALSESQAFRTLVWLVPVYVVGVFLFSYGLEIYNLPKALRLTAIIVFSTVFIVIILAVLFLLASSKAKTGGSGGSSSKSSSAKKSSAGSSPALEGGWLWRRGPASTLGPSAGTEAEERTVPEAPPPRPLTCPSCGRSYVPAENAIACPFCGHERSPA